MMVRMGYVKEVVWWGNGKARKLITGKCLCLEENLVFLNIKTLYGKIGQLAEKFLNKIQITGRRRVQLIALSFSQ